MYEAMDEIQETALPTNFALRSKYDRSYLAYVNDIDEMSGFLKFSEDRLSSPFARFQVEKSKSNNGDLVHIRCSYNNKFWVRWSPGSSYIVAAATQMEEDVSNPTCTLFHPVYDSDSQVFRFRHVQLNRYLKLRTGSKLQHFQGCLFAGSEEALELDYSDITMAVDLDTLFILPKHVAFKGDNGHYLQPYRTEVYVLDMKMLKEPPFLKFSASDFRDPSVANEVFMTSDGHVRIKNNVEGKFWIRDPNWIHVTGKESELHDTNTLFFPFKVGDNKVALRSKANDKFCSRLTLDGKVSCLNAGVSTITEEAIMEVEDIVTIRRTIYDVNFRLKDARIYEETPMTMSTGELINRNSEPDKLKKKLLYDDFKSSTWSSSSSTKKGVKVTLEGGGPKVISGELEISKESGSEYTWGETTETRSKMQVEHEVSVPPSTRVKVSVLATKASYVVPFSYSQRDVLIDGKTVVQHFDDGAYTGTNCYNYTFTAKEEPL